jgi:hypothetical protein
MSQIPGQPPIIQFPTKVWDGTSQNPNNGYISPDPDDWAQIIGELQATQQAMFPGLPHSYVFDFASTLVIATALRKFVAETPGTFVKALAAVNTAPTGSAAIFDIQKNGTSIFNITTANRPTIAISAFTGISGPPDTLTFAAGDVITASCLQIGSTVAGVQATLSLFVKLTPP